MDLGEKQSSLGVLLFRSTEVGQAKVAEVDAILDALHTDEARRFFEFALFLRRVAPACLKPFYRVFRAVALLVSLVSAHFSAWLSRLI